VGDSRFPVFKGNCPKNVNKDAKYVVRTVDGRLVVALSYLSSNGEQWLATSEYHPGLVEVVNAVKVSMGAGPNGPFYINEYAQVIVPVADGTYYFAGDYEESLRFEFEGITLSGEGVGLDGRLLSPGDNWDGPHPGIPYILKAGGGDIYYKSEPRPHVIRQVFLSSVVRPVAARSLAARIQAVKGSQGGRFYINEWREMFAPVNEGGVYNYVYIGHLDDDEPWFPKP